MGTIANEAKKQAGRQVVRLRGLTCADCAARFERMIRNVPGVTDARVNFVAAKLTIEGRTLSKEEIESIGAFEGIKVLDAGEDETAEGRKGNFGTDNRRAAVSGISLVSLVLAFVSRWLHAPELLTNGLFLTTIVLGGWENFKKGIPNLFRLRFTMNTLMTIAVFGALAIGYWEEAAVVAFLFGVSEALEVYTAERARRSIRELMDIAPKTATVRRNGEERVLPVEEIEIGDIMLVKPGEKIAMDGEVVKGSTTVNEAPVTGESLPAEKKAGDEVFAGTLNQAGAIEVKVTKRVQDTTIAKIIALVEEAQEQRAPSQAFVDRFAKYYTPAVVVLAVLIALVPPLFLGASWQPSIYNALALLIVACPCALVVSTPVAILSAIGNAARNGVLIKGGIHLENAGSLKAVAFDKTGTLTQGEPVVTDIIPLNGGEEEALGKAAAIERFSEHPVAKAIVSHVKKRGMQTPEAENFQVVTGKGAFGTIDGVTYLIGSPRFFAERGVSLAELDAEIARLQNEGKTAMIFGTEKRALAIIAVADELRETSRRAIAQLKRIGIAKTVLLTGDNEATARAIAAKAGIDDYRAELLPEDKVAVLDELLAKYERIAMVGDGVNDAPALAKATTGIAMGGAGTDTALETADIVLMADDLAKLPYTIRLGRAALRVIKQNIAFSIAIKMFATFLVFPGWLTLWLAILSDMGATILVTLNGIRLLRMRPEEADTAINASDS
ncbi:heavy metal translocating P-type ATPase [Bacillaceae bacterium]